MCFGTVSPRHGAGRWPATTTNGWRAPGGTPPPRQRQSPPPVRPKPPPPHVLHPAKARCSGFLTSGWKNLRLTLTGGQYDHILMITVVSVRDLCFCLCIYPTPEAAYKVLHHRNICISLLGIIIEPSTPTKRSVWDWREMTWLESLIYRSCTNMHARGQQVISVSGKSVVPPKRFPCVVFHASVAHLLCSCAGPGRATLIFKRCAGAVNPDSTRRYGSE